MGSAGRGGEGQFLVDLTSGDGSVADVDFLDNFYFGPTADLTVARTIDFPSGAPRHFWCFNPSGSSADLTIRLGTSSVAMVPGTEQIFYTNGATNFLVTISGGGGATTFLALTDTPSSYVGQELKFVRVNAGGSALEFTDAPTGGGGGVPFSGVAVYKSGAAQSVPNNSFANVDWDNEFYDVGGWFDSGSSTTTFTVPSGVTKVMGTVNIQWEPNATGDRQIQVVINNAINPNFLAVNEAVEAADTYGHGHSVAFGPVEVTAGDTVIVRVRQNSGVALDLNQGTNGDGMVCTIWAAEAVAPAGVTASRIGKQGGSQTLATDTATAITFDTEFFDIGGWADLGSNNDRFVVPAGVSTIEATGGVTFATNATGGRELWIEVDGVDAGRQQVQASASAGSSLEVSTGPIQVSPGDIVQLIAVQRSGGNLAAPANDNTFFSIKASETTTTATTIFSGARVNKASTTNLPNNTLTAVDWQTEVFDDGGWFTSPSTDFVVPSGVTRVSVSASVAFAAAAGGERRVVIRINSVTRVSENVAAATSAVQTVAVPITALNVTAGDTISVWALQDSGGAINALNSNGSHFAIHEVK